MWRAATRAKVRASTTWFESGPTAGRSLVNSGSSDGGGTLRECSGDGPAPIALECYITRVRRARKRKPKLEQELAFANAGSDPHCDAMRLRGVGKPGELGPAGSCPQAVKLRPDRRERQILLRADVQQEVARARKELREALQPDPDAAEPRGRGDAAKEQARRALLWAGRQLDPTTRAFTPTWGMLTPKSATGKAVKELAEARAAGRGGR